MTTPGSVIPDTKKTSVLWENDPFLLAMTPEREAVINNGQFTLLQRKGLTPAQAFPKNAARRTLYEEWIAAQKKA